MFLQRLKFHDVHVRLSSIPLGIMTMDDLKFRRTNLRYVVECRHSWAPKSKYYWVYHFGKSFYIGPWSDRCHHSVRSVEDLTRWIERNYFTRVIRVILEKDLKKETSLLKDRAIMARSDQNHMSGSGASSTTQAFMARLPARTARLVGATSVVTFKSPSSNIRWVSKRRSRP